MILIKIGCQKNLLGSYRKSGRADKQQPIVQRQNEPPRHQAKTCQFLALLMMELSGGCQIGKKWKMKKLEEEAGGEDG